MEDAQRLKDKGRMTNMEEKEYALKTEMEILMEGIRSKLAASADWDEIDPKGALVLLKRVVELHNQYLEVVARMSTIRQSLGIKP